MSADSCLRDVALRLGPTVVLMTAAGETTAEAGRCSPGLLPVLHDRGGAPIEA